MGVEEIWLTNELLNSNIWTLDSGCTKHFCNNVKWFIKLEMVEPIQILCAGGERLMSNERGSIKIHSNLTLENVYLVRKGLQRNLISVSEITSMDKNTGSVTFNHSNAVIKTTTGSCIVPRRGRLFSVEIPLIPSLLSAFTTTTSKQETPPTAKTNKENRKRAPDKPNKLSLIELWHRRLGDCSYSVLKKMARTNVLKTFPKYLNIPDTPCVSCELSKAHKLPFRGGPAEVKTTRINEKLHSDTCGPFKVADRDGNKYFLTLIDDYSRLSRTYLLKSKSQAKDILIQEFKQLTVKSGFAISTFRSDGGSEFFKLDDFMREEGITHEVSLPFTHELHGVAERYNRLVMESAIAMLTRAKLPQIFWGDAVIAATYLHGFRLNSTLAAKFDDPTYHTPLGVWNKTKPDTSHLRAMFCRAYAWIPNEKRKKTFLPKARITMLIGYGQSTEKTEIYSGYKLYDLETKKIFYSRHVRFDESTLGTTEAETIDPFFTDYFAPESVPQRKRKRKEIGSKQSNPRKSRRLSTTPKWSKWGSDSVLNTIDKLVFDDRAYNISLETRRENCEHEINLTESTIEEYHQIVNKYEILPSHDPIYEHDSNWTEEANVAFTDIQHLEDTRIQLKSLIENAALIATLQNHGKIPLPNNINECSIGIYADKWKESNDKEYDSIILNETWDLVKRPPGMPITKCKWVFRIKYNADGSIDKFKSRLVACGYNQVKGVNFENTYSPVARLTSIKTMLALAAKRGMKIMQLDFDSAYLQAPLTEYDVYIEQPPGYVNKDPSKKGYVCKLKKSIYGLKQAGREWNKELNRHLTEMGFTQLKSDACIYKYTETNESGKTETCILGVYVDDCPYMATSEELRLRILRELQNRLKLTDLQEMTWFLGMEVTQSENEITLSQHRYLENVIKRFGYNNMHFKTVDTPHVPGKYYSKTMSPVVGSIEWHAMAGKRNDVKQMNGCLMYLLATRPDIRWIVCHLSRFVQNPGLEHYNAYKQIFKYLLCTQKKCLHFYKNAKDATTYNSFVGLDEKGVERDLTSLLALADSDFGGCIDTRKSTRGYCIFFNGSLLTSKSKIDSTHAISSSEAELNALTLVTQEVEWLRLLLTELGEDMTKPTVVLEDNTSCIAMVNEPNAEAARTKHLCLKKHWVKERIDRMIIKIAFHATVRMLADFFTKPVSKHIFHDMRSSLVS